MSRLPGEPPGPPRLLVSVRDADEADIACAAGADLVDAKDPLHGALGALPEAVVGAIVSRVGERAATSAVAGEPETDDALVANVAAMAATGVGYVKVALRRRQDGSALTRAAAAAPGRLIGVLFAEDGVPPDVLPRVTAAGWRGVMLDTRGKTGGRLTDLIAPNDLAAFVAQSRAHGLLCGLAGSLRIADIGPLAALGPDYLGFRGGLCRGGDRRNALDPLRVGEAVAALRIIGLRDVA